MNFIDTHFHLDLWPQPSELLQAIEKHKVYTIAVTNTPSVFRYTRNLTQNSKYVRAALGLHPELVFERHGELPEFRKHLDMTRYIGEVGLDYSNKDKANNKLQRDIFEAIVTSCAESQNKILTIHSRRAEKDVINIVGNKFPGKVILHWYSGSLRELERAIDFGFYFSINSAMVKSKTGQAIIKVIPIQRLLTESDGPFITKAPGTPYSPIQMHETVARLADLMGRDKYTVQQIIHSNFKEVLK